MPIDFEPEPHVAQLVERTAAFVRQEVLGMVQQLLADTEIHLAAARGPIWRPAWKFDRGECAAQVTAIAKVIVAEAVGRVVDRSARACGALSVSGEFPSPATWPRSGSSASTAALSRRTDGPSVAGSSGSSGTSSARRTAEADRTR
jgi:alkylation response protein AidB-like acyl-CoA dehydrogenase